MAQKYLLLLTTSAIICSIKSDIVPPIVELLKSKNNDSLATALNVTNYNFMNIGKEWLANVNAGKVRPIATPILQSPESCQACECGIRNTKKRIVGGHETEVNEYPWMAFLMIDGRPLCGGALINDRYVLSAAHCVASTYDTPEVLSVNFLVHDYTSTTEDWIERKILRVIKNPKFNVNHNLDSDISLLQLDRPVTFKDKFVPACLPTTGKSYTGYDATITGWGYTSDGGHMSDTLVEVTVPILANRVCRQNYNMGKEGITKNMLCAGVPEGGKDSCQGDSGGPLHVEEKGVFEVAGVVSFGNGCAVAGKPGVYTRVTQFEHWIKSNTLDACYCDL